MKRSTRRRAVRPALGHIPFYRPFTDHHEIEEVSDAIRTGWLTTGPRVRRFEQRIARLVGAGNAVALNSCTAALHLALSAAGVGEGDEVITSPYTFAATGEAILYLRARPVFADIVGATLNIDPEKVARAVTSRTRAIVPVHIAGLPCDMGPIRELARKRHLRIVDDAAHAIGASTREGTIGSFSDATCFSFYATKNLTTGEGGMVTTNDRRLADRVRRLSLHGMTRDAWKRYTRRGNWRYDIVELGFKDNMTDVAAGLGLAQLDKFRSMQAARRRLALRYSRLLAGCPAYDLPFEQPGTVHAWHLYILRVRARESGLGRDRLIEALRRRGIGTSVHFLPLHLHSYYRKAFGFRAGSFPITERESARALSLPLYPGLTEEAQDRVVDILLEVARRRSR